MRIYLLTAMFAIGVLTLLAVFWPSAARCAGEGCSGRCYVSCGYDCQCLIFGGNLSGTCFGNGQVDELVKQGWKVRE
jgi:hypothetical protein